MFLIFITAGMSLRLIEFLLDLDFALVFAYLIYRRSSRRLEFLISRLIFRYISLILKKMSDFYKFRKCLNCF